MTNRKLDLHGFRHHEVPLKVENFLYLNQENMPILIICGNSQKMINIVKDVLEGIDCTFEIGVESHDKLYRNPFLDPLKPHELKPQIAALKGSAE